MGRHQESWPPCDIVVDLGLRSGSCMAFCEQIIIILLTL